MTESEAKEFFLKNVPRETLAKLENFVELLVKWQSQVNLVSRGTIDQIWLRHLYDSYQLARFIEDKNSPIIDLGSGAGLPGIVLAIMDCSVTLIESNIKKTTFLQEVIRQLKLKAFVLKQRIEHISPTLPELLNQQNISYSSAVFTARALAPLDQLFTYVFPLFKKDACCLFLKGANYFDEIKMAQKKWLFDYHEYPSLTAPQSKVLMIKHLQKRT